MLYFKSSLSPLLLSTHCTPSFSLRGKSDIWYHFGRYLTLPLNISFAIHWNHSPSPSVTFLHSGCCPLPSPGLLLLICFLCWLISSTPLITSCILSALQLATFSPPPKIPSFSPQVGAQVLLVLPTGLLTFLLHMIPTHKLIWFQHESLNKRSAYFSLFLSTLTLPTLRLAVTFPIMWHCFTINSLFQDLFTLK